MPHSDNEMSWDEYFIHMAVTAARKSKDPSTKVGAVLARPDRTISSVGFNGFPRRMPDNDQYINDPAFRAEKLRRMVHAEQNALRLAKDSDTTGFTLAVSRHPCDMCALEIATTGVTRVLYLREPDFEHRWSGSLKDAKKILEESGIELVEVSILD